MSAPRPSLVARRLDREGDHRRLPAVGRLELGVLGALSAGSAERIVWMQPKRPARGRAGEASAQRRASADRTEDHRPGWDIERDT